MPNVQFIRDILYKMKQDYGVPVKYGILEKNSIDPLTGLNTVSKRVYAIKKAILLPTKLSRKFAQDIAYLAANKNFTYGALFDEKISIYMIDARDLPKSLVLNMDNFLFSKHERYVIKTAEILEHDCGWLLTVETHVGANPFDLIFDKVYHTCQFQQEVAYALN